MIRIVIGGQIEKQIIAKTVREMLGEEAKVDIKGDFDGAMAVKDGRYDYYLGACNTGGGGALAMAIALLGHNKCITLAMPGKLLSDEEIGAAVQEGKIAFGFTTRHLDRILPCLIAAIKRKESGAA